MKDKFLIALVGILVVLVAFFILISRNYSKDERIASFRDSLTTNVFGIELLADNSEMGIEESSIRDYNSPLFRPEAGEFVLALDRIGSNRKDLYIRSNTCPTGVRIEGRVDIDQLKKAKGRVATLNVYGVNKAKSKSTFYRAVSFSDEFLTHTLHLPSQLLDDNDSVFPEYRISNGKHSDHIRYDVMCY